MTILPTNLHVSNQIAKYAARILQLLSESNESSHQLFTQFVTGISTAEIKLSISETQKFKTMERILELAAFPKANVITLDGLRVEYNDGWGLVRASNTSPALLLRFEADTEARLVEIQNEFKALIHNADKSIEINF